MASGSIPIRYINCTGKTDFQVLVFTKNFSVNTPETYHAAWQILNANIEIGACYEQGSQKILAGPFTAELVSTWEINHMIPLQLLHMVLIIAWTIIM